MFEKDDKVYIVSNGRAGVVVGRSPTYPETRCLVQHSDKDSCAWYYDTELVLQE